jgi:hypothetical protein
MEGNVILKGPLHTKQSRDKGNVRPLVSPRASTSVRRPMSIL